MCENGVGIRHKSTQVHTGVKKMAESILPSLSKVANVVHGESPLSTDLLKASNLMHHVYQLLDENDRSILSRVDKEFCELEKSSRTADQPRRFVVKHFTKSVGLIEWATIEGCPWDGRTCESAAGEGHLEVLKWLRERRCPWDERTCASAAGGGHLEVLEWLRTQGCPWDERTCTSAAHKGHLEVLKWLREQGCPWSIFTCASAARGGHLEVLKWLREQGCPWDDFTCEMAAANGHLETLKWAREQGCSLNKEECKNVALNNNHTEVLEWLEETQ